MNYYEGVSIDGGKCDWIWVRFTGTGPFELSYTYRKKTDESAKFVIGLLFFPTECVNTMNLLFYFG